MTRFDSASRKPKSLARLIAEEAFSRPAPPASTVQAPVVRVIGRRLSLKAPEPAAVPAPVPAAPEAPAHKPRVFVIRKPDEAPALPEPQAAEATPLRPLRARRRSVAPVRVVYSAPERPPEPTPPASLDLLAGSLAGLEPTLDVIRRAMAFDFRDPAIGAEWEQLSRTAEELSSELVAS